VLKDNKVSIGEMAAYFESIEIKSVYLQWRIFGAGGQESIRKRASAIESLRSRLPVDYDTNSTAERDIKNGLDKCNHGSGVPYYRQGKSLTKVGACSRVNIHRCEQKDVAVGFASAGTYPKAEVIGGDAAGGDAAGGDAAGGDAKPFDYYGQRKKGPEVVVNDKVRERREKLSCALVCLYALSSLVLFKLTHALMPRCCSLEDLRHSVLCNGSI
jgi:hypothetical protein